MAPENINKKATTYISLNRYFFKQSALTALCISQAIDISKLVVVFLYEKYQEKEWYSLEFRAIRGIIKQRNYEKIMFIVYKNGEGKVVYLTPMVILMVAITLQLR